MQMYNKNCLKPLQNHVEHLQCQPRINKHKNTSISLAYYQGKSGLIDKGSTYINPPPVDAFISAFADTLTAATSRWILRKSPPRFCMEQTMGSKKNTKTLESLVIWRLESLPSCMVVVSTAAFFPLNSKSKKKQNTEGKIHEKKQASTWNKQPGLGSQIATWMWVSYISERKSVYSFISSNTVGFRKKQRISWVKKHVFQWSFCWETWESIKFTCFNM